MSSIISRRTMLAILTATATGAAWARQRDLSFGPPQAFSFDALVERARGLAGQPFSPPRDPVPEVIARIDYDEHNEIKHPKANGLFARGPGEAPVTFFHLGKFFPHPVKLHALEGERAREVLYRRDTFEFPPGNPAHDVPDDAGFAGFRMHYPKRPATTDQDDWFAFLGASYFRSSGDGFQYGLSARGIAVDPANPVPPFKEEFPGFTEFWITPLQDGKTTVYALLDGPSIAGAYRFDISRTPRVVFDVHCRLFMRKAVQRLGLAPLTSMYWYSETMRWEGSDWRPEVHDSDGLAILTGTGEQIWRPLNNPPQVMVSAFADENPRGFGLLQRDRALTSYMDEIGFERRPNAWVEILGQWGKGSIQLLEINTVAEYHDNIGAFFVPAAPVKAGDEFDLRYRIHWSIEDPLPKGLARCVATRMDRGGIVPFPLRRPRWPGFWRSLVVEFQGDNLRDHRPDDSDVVVTTSRGKCDGIGLEAFPDDRTWRTFFRVGDYGPADPIELRLHLRDRSTGKPLTETWLAQLHPRWGWKPSG